MIKGKGKLKILIVMLLSIEVSLISINCIDDKENTLYEIYMDDRVIGYMDDTQSCKSMCESLVIDIKDRLDTSDLDTEGIKFKKIKDGILISNKDEIQEKILSCVNIETNLTNLIISGESYGIIAKADEGKEVLKKVGDIYVDSMKINKDNILSMDIKSNVVYETIKTKVSNISAIDDIAKDIVNKNKTKNIVDVSIKYRETKEVEVEPTAKTVSQDEMYIGELIEEKGSSGSKIVTSDVTYKNGVKIDENIIDEKTLVEAKDTVIYKGSRNPVDYKVAFLTHPTRGGYITSQFGSRWGRNHNGIDISHNTGDPVYAGFDGVVKEASYKYSYGNKILLEHEGKLQTIYAHLSAFDVKVGDVVKKGDLIGRVGNTGNSTGSHLHFELRVDGKPVDPKIYIEELG